MADHDVDDFQDIFIIDIVLDGYVNAVLNTPRFIITSILHTIEIYINLQGWEHAIFTCIVLIIKLIQLLLSDMLVPPKTPPPHSKGHMPPLLDF